jgi:hypothetical protein
MARRPTRSLRVGIALVALGVALAALSSGAAQSQTGQQPRVITQYGLVGGDSRAVAVRGTTVLMGYGPRLMLLDGAERGKLRPHGAGLVLPARPEMIVTEGSLAYVAAGTAGVRVVDTSDPRAPAEVGAYDTPGSAYGLSRQGARTYVADGDGGLLVLDTSDPRRPRRTGALDTTGSARGVAIGAGYAYVADGRAGLQVVSLANPDRPVLVATLDTPGFVRNVAIAGRFAYVADAGYFTEASRWVAGTGLRVYDISGPAAPRFLAALAVGDAPNRVLVDGSRAYVSVAGILQLSSLVILDLVDPARPSVLGRYQPSTGYLEDVALSGSTAYLSEQSMGLQEVDVSNPRSPVFVGHYGKPYDARGIDISGRYAYVADRRNGLTVFDISDPALPAMLGFTRGHYFAGDGMDVVVSGRYAYMSDYWGGLRVVDIADPMAPTIVNTVDTPGTPGEMQLAGSSLFLADGEGGVRVFDVSDPVRPSEIGSLAGLAYGIEIADGLAYVPAHDEGVRVVDVSDPTRPREVGRYRPPGGRLGPVAAHGGYLYVGNDSRAYDQRELNIVDVRDPTRPRQVGVVTDTNTVASLAVRGPSLYVGYEIGTDSRLLRVFDILEPTRPRLVTAAIDPWRLAGQELTFAGEYAYATAGGNAFTVIWTGPAPAEQPASTATPTATPTPTATTTTTPTTPTATPPGSTATPAPTTTPTDAPTMVAPTPLEHVPPWLAPIDLPLGGTSQRVPTVPVGSDAVAVLTPAAGAPFELTLEVPAPRVGHPSLGVRLQPLDAASAMPGLGAATVTKAVSIDVWDADQLLPIEAHDRPLRLSFRLSAVERRLCEDAPGRIAFLRRDAVGQVTRLPATLDCGASEIRASLSRTSTFALALLDAWGVLPLRALIPLGMR